VGAAANILHWPKEQQREFEWRLALMKAFLLRLGLPLLSCFPSNHFNYVMFEKQGGMFNKNSVKCRKARLFSHPLHSYGHSIEERETIAMKL
jgi:hypothetical protein